MKKILLICLLLLCNACTTTSQVAPPIASQTDTAPKAEVAQKPAPPSNAENLHNDLMNDLAIYAMSLAETPYRYGGVSPETGFDCSGFVRHVFQKSLELQLPRTSVEISRVGEPLQEDQLRPGDLVFFNTQQHPFSHVGIYVGEARFVHAPKTGKSIVIASMRQGYWRKRYSGARRITLY